MKALKYLAFALAGLILLCVLLLAAAAVVVDGPFVKSRLERYLKEEKQRTLTIEGSPTVRIFPVAGLSLGRTVLTERASDKVFVALDSLEVGVRVLPLLTGEMAVDALSLTGFRASIVKSKDGSFNFQDLLGTGKPAGDKPAAKEEEKRDPPRLRIAEIRIEGAQLAFRDESTGQEVTVSGFNLKTGRLEDDAPSPIAMSVNVSGKRPDLGLKVAVSGSARMNLARQSFAFSGLDARVTGNADNLRGLNLGITGDIAADGGRQMVDVKGFKLEASGNLDRDAMTLALAAPRVEVTPSRASGSAVTGTLKIAGPQRNVNANLKIEAVAGTAASLSIPALVLDLDGSAEGNTVKAQINTALLANLADRAIDLPKIAASITLGGPMIPQKSVTLPIQASFKANMSRQTMAAEVSTRFDESTILAKAAAAKFQPLDASFDLNIDKLNLDRYLRPGPDKSPASDPPIDLSPLKGKSVTGKVQIGSLQVKRIKLANIRSDVRLAGGKLEVGPHSASLYDGKLEGRLTADAEGNRIALKEEIKAVTINPLLRDVADKDILEGRGDVSIDVTMAGATVGAMKRALAGNAAVELKDGAYKGINLAETFRKAASLGTKSGTQGGDSTQKTDFSEMKASFVIKGGVAHNEDLSMKSPFVRVGGLGDIDIGNSRLDYTAKAALVATATGQQGRDDAAGVTIPVRVYGSFDAVKYDIQYGSVFSGIARGLGGLLGSDRNAGKDAGSKGGAPASAVDSVKDRIKGLFGR